MALIGLLAVNMIWARPDYGWDMLAYIAVAYQFAGASPSTMHHQTYTTLREAVSERDYQRLTASDDYRRAVATDPVAFNHQLPGYRVKLVYPWLISGLARVGVNPVHGSVLVSKLAYVGIGVVLLIWLSSFLTPLAALVAAWAVTSLSFVIDLAQLSTPDAPSTLVILVALWAVFQADRWRMGLVLLIASIAVRPDNVLWLIAIAAYMMVTDPRKRMAAVLSCVTGITFVLLLSAWAGSPGWATLFHHAFVERVLDQQDFQPNSSPLEYLFIYLRESHPANLPPFSLAFMLLGGCVFIHRVRHHGWADRYVRLLGSATVFAAMHWLLYPDDDRLFAAAYVVTVLAALRTFADASRGPRGLPASLQAVS